MEMRLAVGVRMKPAIFSWRCQALNQRSQEGDRAWGAALPGKAVCLLATFWDPGCGPECARALQGKARYSCVIQDWGYRGASASALSLVRPSKKSCLMGDKMRRQVGGAEAARAACVPAHIIWPALG